MVPAFLKKGDKIAIVSPSGNINPEYIHGAVNVLSGWGLVPIVGKYACGQMGRYSGSESERIFDMQEALDNPEIKAILCSRGGYGLVQIIDNLDFTGFEIHPKWIIGFSDITVLHSLCSNLDVVSLHSIMARDISELPTESDQIVRLKNILFGQLPSYTIPSHKLNRNGQCSGILIGGNLSVLYGLRGTHLDMDSFEKILFIEDIGEKPYHIDRMIHNLKMGGILESINGLIVGQFSDYEEDPLMGKTVCEIIADAVKEYDYPVCFNFPAGHVEYNLPLLLGAEVRLQVGSEVVLSFL
jgi:muramoyltetrapeptide carboxypeptidase